LIGWVQKPHRNAARRSIALAFRFAIDCDRLVERWRHCIQKAPQASIERLAITGGRERLAWRTARKYIDRLSGSAADEVIGGDVA
jgi:hypothetical protein